MIALNSKKIYEEIPFLLLEEVSINPYNEYVYGYFIIDIKLEEYINIEN